MARRRPSASAYESPAKSCATCKYLLLKDHDSQGVAETALQAGMRIGHRLPSQPPLDIRIHHAALERAGTKERDLDDQIAEGAWLGTGQERPLARALDLKDADGLGGADQVIDRRIVQRKIVDRQIDAPTASR